MASRASEIVSGSLRWSWLATAAFLITGFFIFLGFPYDRLSDYLALEAGRSTGTRVRIASLGPRVHWTGPGVTATGVRVSLEDGSHYDIDRALLRPAWSLDWLRGTPAIHLTLDAAMGTVVGTYSASESSAFRGTFESSDLSGVPAHLAWPGLELRGSAALALEIERIDLKWVGRTDFQLNGGSLSLDAFPMALPYQRVDGALKFGQPERVEIETLDLKGPLLNAEVRGDVRDAPTFRDAPMSLQVQVTAQPEVREALALAGVRLTKDGTGRIRISGSPASPRVH